MINATIESKFEFQFWNIKTKITNRVINNEIKDASSISFSLHPKIDKKKDFFYYFLNAFT